MQVVDNAFDNVWGGFNKFWVYARRNDAFYLANKIISVILATIMAVHTQSLKLKIVQYLNDNPDDHVFLVYNVTYWTLFIFYAFHAVDELIELYAVYFKREKGALGLLLELNYFLGVGIIVTCLTIVYKEEYMNLPEGYEQVYGWLKYQVIFFYIVLGIGIGLLIAMWDAQKKCTRATELK